MSENIPTFPVTGWDIKHLPGYDVILIRLPFLSSPTQQPNEANPGRWYVFQPGQAQQLANAITEALGKVQAGATPKGPPLNS